MAPPPAESNDVFSGLVRTIGSANDRQEQPVTTSRGKIVLFPGDTLPDHYYATPITKISEPDDGMGALDFLSDVYEQNDYYDSGYWGPTEINISGAIYAGPLPPCGLEDFCCPVEGVMTSGFGYRVRYNRLHKGVDINLCAGDTVKVALSGTVGRVGYERGGYGRFIVINHPNGVETRYAHLQETLVAPGETVKAGQPVAIGGNTGNSTGPHLHFEIRYLGRPLDPCTVYNFGQQPSHLPFSPK